MNNLQVVIKHNTLYINILNSVKIAYDYTNNAIFITLKNTFKGKVASFNSYKDSIP